jgi:hypothetical protein
MLCGARYLILSGNEYKGRVNVKLILNIHGTILVIIA